MLSTTFLALATLLHAAWAFEGSAPLLAWSSSDRPELFSLKPSNGHESPFGALVRSDDVCGFDTVLVVDHIGLHANDLKSLPPSSHIAARLKSPKRSLSVPYTKCHTSSDVFDAAESLAKKCGARFDVLHVSQHPDTGTIGGERGVYYLQMPAAYGAGSYRRQRAEDQERGLSRMLSHIESTSPSHLVIYTGSSESDLSKRQAVDTDLHPPPFSFSSNNGSVKGAAADNDGIFQRYSLFSTGLIVSLIVVIFLLVPIILLAVRSLASIQSSVRLDAPKGSAVDKKNQ